MPPKSRARSEEIAMNMQALALAFLAAAAIGGVAWVFLYPLLSGQRKAENRRASVAKAEPVAVRQNQKDQRSRREQIEGSLREVEARRLKDSKITLTTRLMQAGLNWEPRKFMIASAILAAIAFGLAMLVGGGPIGAVGMAFAAGFGLPRWGLSFLKKRRE
jgi:tight adherence protein B